MRNKKLAAAILAISLALPLALIAKVKSYCDKSASFSSYKTYAWGRNVETTRPMAGVLILGAIDSELRARGLQQEDIGAADLIVRYQVASDNDMNIAGGDPTFVQTGGAILPGDTMWATGYSVPSSGVVVRKGTLVIDVYDRAAHKLIWTGIATETLQDKPKKAMDQIHRIVSEVLRELPVRPN